MLDSHPDLSIPHETHFILQLFEAPDYAHMNAETFFRTVTEFSTWPDFHLPEEGFWRALCEVHPFSIADGLRAFYRLYSIRSGKVRWGDKTPTYTACIEKICRLLPESHFIHVIRDGRDVAVSIRPLWFSPGTEIEILAKDWMDRVETARLQGKLCQHYMEVRYEDLLTDTRGVLERICDFIALPFDPSMEAYHRNARNRLAEAVGRYGPAGEVLSTSDQRLEAHRLTRGPPDRSRIESWRTQLPANDRRDFEAIAGSLLTQLGYELQTP